MTGLLTLPLAKAAGDEEALKLLADGGFDAIDYSMHTYKLDDHVYTLSPTALFQKYQGLAQAMKGLGLRTCQLHTHYPTYVGAAQQDEQILQAVVSGIWAAQALECPYAVVHPMLRLAPLDDSWREACWEMNRRFFTKLIPILRECGVRLGIENMFCFVKGRYQPTPVSTAQDMITYIDRMNDIAGEERFVACLDTGHAHLLALNPAEMAMQLNDRLKLVHLHDNLRTCDSHNAPYLGSVDWDAFLEALAAIGYHGALSLEAHGFLSGFPYGLYPQAVRLLADIARHFEETLEEKRSVRLRSQTKQAEEQP